MVTWGRRRLPILAGVTSCEYLVTTFRFHRAVDRGYATVSRG